ncbi:cohesin domain-containing protein [Patescibacteria group bacterium]|nr:cohesin domain-containing protein [Patescibacteria group bacterium]
MDNTKQTNAGNRIYIYLLAAFFVVFIATGLFLLITNKPANPSQSAQTTATLKEQPTSLPTVAPKRGFVNLSEATESAGIVTFNVVADSDGENVSAYDIQIGYDPLAFDFQSAVSIDPSFQVYPFHKDKLLTLTAVKATQDQTPSIFTNKPVIKLNFKSKKSGNYTFSVLSSIGKETTKFVNTKTQIINPQVNEMNVIVK